ncbi:hypothetical protein [Gordonia polyisoprenivorans]|uniref:hypothetical protein n=1 Tax=Gordonia polyisoprenivorans TaxID=84595 RepID=UPI00036B0952|nr:hypothetical protein [Gordonia polyisoprenivorans]
MTLAHADRTTPTWIREVDIALAANPQVVLTGNLRDFALIPTDKPGGPPYRSFDITSALVHALSQAGHQNIVSFNPAEGLGILSEQGHVASTLIRDAEKVAGNEASLTRQLRVLIRLVASAEDSCCLVIEGASRLRTESETLGENCTNSSSPRSEHFSPLSVIVLPARTARRSTTRSFGWSTAKATFPTGSLATIWSE